MANTRTESDTMGPIEVADDVYWGAQAQRSLGNFKIGWEKQPEPVVRAMGIVKKAAAQANMDLGKMDPEIGKVIVDVAGEVIEGKLNAHFPAGRVADGLGHPVQHEHERGHLEPCHRDHGRRERLQEAGSPERSCEHVPVVERLLPDGHAHRRR